MKRLLIDTNIIIDVLEKREPFHVAATSLFSLADKKKVRLFAAGISFVNAHYILIQKSSEREVRTGLAKLRLVTGILPCDEKVIDLALTSSFKDFEDAMQYYIAQEGNCDVIITRNQKDFKGADIPVMTAAEFLKSFKRVN
jgi:predicted nucleic acid-binding protein